MFARDFFFCFCAEFCWLFLTCCTSLQYYFLYVSVMLARCYYCVYKILKKLSVSNDCTLIKLCALCAYRLQLNVLLCDYFISICLSFNIIKGIVFNHFHDVCSAWLAGVIVFLFYALCYICLYIFVTLYLSCYGIIMLLSSSLLLLFARSPGCF